MYVCLWNCHFDDLEILNIYESLPQASDFLFEQAKRLGYRKRRASNVYENEIGVLRITPWPLADMEPITDATDHTSVPEWAHH